MFGSRGENRAESVHELGTDLRVLDGIASWRGGLHGSMGLPEALKSLAVGLGLNLVPSAVQYLPGVVKVLATSAVAPTALCAVILNLILPEED